ncbi:unnamed protein product [Acanthoscelides obtectus]|uniref:Ribosomal L1 domain-containing protein 1 n=1 Tax=Acanthoscelides obtectus TaxID=200917 RepID=A0A9P0P416_ACAOB|nr:unnamed protein product [Acanthoscelides obtectus]CAK1651731.1 Ribosomal L1 domain-containing protein 1 [Acanthoscelides obtectus]
MAKSESVKLSKKKPKEHNLLSGVASKKPKKATRKSLGPVLLHPAKKKLQEGTPFLKSPKGKKKELTSDGKVTQIEEVTQNGFETFTLSFTEKYNIKTKDIHNAIKGIIKYRESNPKLQNQLFDEQVPLFLMISVHKIPKGHPKLLRVPMRHTILGLDDEICLIVPDVKGIKNAEHEKHVEHYEKLLESRGVTNIKKIMTFHELRTEYETFEQLSRLVDLYDIFLVDGKISGKVVAKCGRLFYKKRKVPTAVKLHATNLHDHIEKALSKTILNLHLKSSSYNVQFGHTKMESNKLVENLKGVIEFLDSNFPGKFENIKSIHMYATRSTSIPIYVSLDSPSSLNVPKLATKKPKAYKTYSGELTAQLNTEVTVHPSGKVIVHRINDQDEETLDVSKQVKKTGSEAPQTTDAETQETRGSLDKSKKSKKKKVVLEEEVAKDLNSSGQRSNLHKKNKKHRDKKMNDEIPDVTELTIESKKSKKEKLKEEVASEVMDNYRKDITEKEKSKKKKIKTSCETVNSIPVTQQGATGIKQPKKRKKTISTNTFESEGLKLDNEPTGAPVEKRKKRVKTVQVGEWTIIDDDEENQPMKSKKSKKNPRAAFKIDVNDGQRKTSLRSSKKHS